jgi:hypothetical protein
MEKIIDSEFSNLRTESKNLAKDLAEKNNQNLLIMNSGVDSQIILSSFISQNLNIVPLFFLIPGINDSDIYYIKYLERLYNISINIKNVDLNNKEHEIKTVLDKFIQNDYQIINGIIGPDFVRKNNVIFLAEKNHDLEKIIDSKNYIEWFKFDRIYNSIMKDPVMEDFLTAFCYFEDANFLDRRLNEIDYWNNYIKIHIYTKYWNDELFYYPLKQILKTSRSLNLKEYN